MHFNIKRLEVAELEGYLLKALMVGKFRKDYQT